MRFYFFNSLVVLNQKSFILVAKIQTNNMKQTLILLYFSIMCLFATAQNATLKGIVKDEKGEPAIQANVIIDASRGLATVTNFDGEYTLSLPPGDYSVLYRYLGKEDVTIKITLTEGQTLTRDVTLKDKVELINTVVVSASKYEKKMSEETVSMEVLKSDLMQANNIVNVEEGMNKVPGVTIIEGQANIRGGAGWSYGAGSRVMILYDDLPLLAADAGDTKWSFMPTEITEQVEVIKGAASSLYGSGALNGVINVRTGWAGNTPETRVNMWSGVFGSPRDKNEAWWFRNNQQPFFSGFNFAHMEKVKRVDYVIHGQFQQDNAPLESNASGDARIGAKFRYRPKKVEGLSMGANVNALRSWGAAFFLWNGLGDQARLPMPNTASTYQNNRITIDPFISYYDNKNNNFSLKTRYLNTANRNNTGQGSIPIVYNWDLQYNRFFIKSGFNVVGGLAGYFSTTRSPEDDVSASLVGEHNGANVAPYIQVEKKLFDDRLNLTLGSRYEYFKIRSLTYDTILKSDLTRPLFRIGANYRAAEATFIRASYGEGFRFPTMAELFINSNIGGIGLFPNPGLQSESGWYGELGIKQGLKFGDWSAYVDAALFINQYQNMMEFNFGLFGVTDLVGFLETGDISALGVGFASQNVGNTRIMGIELSGGSQGKIGNFPLNILVGYTYIDPKALNWDDPLELVNSAGQPVPPGAGFLELLSGLEATRDRMPTYAGSSSSSENILKYRNRHTFQLDIGTSWRKLDFGVSVQYRSWMENIDYFFVSDFLTQESPWFVEQIGAASLEEAVGTGAFSALREFRDKYDGRGTTLVDARIAFRFTENAKLSLVGKNLLNLTYDIRPTYLGNPMSFAAQFNYKFKHDKKEKTKVDTDM
jgi:outer membrane receptor protein involved in Fe transport